MHEQLQTSINYAKLIEIQANQPAFGIDKKQSKKIVKVKSNKGKVKIFSRTTHK